MAVPRAASATTVFPSAVSTSQQDFLVIGGNNKGFNYCNTMVFYKYTFKYFFAIFWCAPFTYLYFVILLYVIAGFSLLHPSSIRYWGSNPQPLDRELFALTTRPWLSPYFQIYY